MVIVAGPNGAGKSTTATFLLRGAFYVEHFVNADDIARGLSVLAPERAAIAAGRVMLDRIRRLAAHDEDFAFETTLASRSFAPFVDDLARYQVGVLFLWLPSAAMALARVRERVAMGGHDVPAADVRRRYFAGLSNFFRLYRPLAAEWRIYDASSVGEPRCVAAGDGCTEKVFDSTIWTTMRNEADHG